MCIVREPMPDTPNVIELVWWAKSIPPAAETVADCPEPPPLSSIVMLMCAVFVASVLAADPDTNR